MHVVNPLFETSCMKTQCFLVKSSHTAQRCLIRSLFLQYNESHLVFLHSERFSSTQKTIFLWQSCATMFQGSPTDSGLYIKHAAKPASKNSHTEPLNATFQFPATRSYWTAGRCETVYNKVLLWAAANSNFLPPLS